MFKHNLGEIVGAVIVVALVGCGPLPTGADVADDPVQVSLNEAGVPDDGNGQKQVTSFARNSPVDCGGSTLASSQTGWFQTITLSNSDMLIDVFHSVITYTNEATGESLSVTDVGPNRYYRNQDGDVVLELSGRAPTWPIQSFIGHVVFNIADVEWELVGGQFYELDAIACAQLT